MKTTTTVVQMAIRLCSLILIVLGALFWTGRALNLLSTHILVGTIFVLALWTLAYLGIGVNTRLAGVVAFLGVVVLVLGMVQNRLLVGDVHWVIQVLHLLVGLAAVGFAESLAARIKRARMKPAEKL